MNEAIVLGTLTSALDDAAGRLSGEAAAALRRAAELLARPGNQREAHPAVPQVGSSATTTFVVAGEDTAAEMGHPDEHMAVLGSPRLALWFEMATVPLLPAPASGTTHVGAGILVHHLDRAVRGDEVAVTARVAAGEGRRVLFACTAMCGDRLVAFGTHHRVVLDGEGHPRASGAGAA